MQKTILFFDFGFGGHVMEWMNHFYHEALKNVGHNFVFVFREDEFHAYSSQMDWPMAGYVRILEMPVWKVALVSTGSLLRKVYCRNIILRKYIRKTNADEVFLINIDQYMPLLALFISGKTKVSGIVYNMYLYNWKGFGLLHKALYGLNYNLYASHNSFGSVFLLNDVSSVLFLNRRFKTARFHFICDPIPEIKSLEYNKFTDPQLIFLHFGGLCSRKGTVRILDALLQIDEYKLRNKVIIFAGVVYPEIKDEFYKKVRLLQDKIEIRVLDRFCSYEELGQLCGQAHFILAPYENISFSSGGIGYGAKFNASLVVPKQGVLGKIVRRNRLGVLLDDYTIASLRYFFETVKSVTTNEEDRLRYINRNSKARFLRDIFASLF